LRALDSYLAKLDSFRKFSKEEFLKEDALHDLAERYFHLAVECVLDIGNHLIADKGLATPGSYKDIFSILSAAAVIPGELAGKLQKWAGFRNILVHNYLEIDHGIAYDILVRDLGELREFARIAAACI
jgi:uncharacterized protein YutE (UPF0331/DUF86 family)